MVLTPLACGPQSSNYDRGYEDGWEGSKDKFLYGFSKQYKRGYEDGDDDVWRFDKGCSDAESGNESDYHLEDDYEYKRGFEECS